MENKMYQFLGRNKKATRGQSLIVSQSDTLVGSFNISRKVQEEFWKLYCDLLESGVHLSLAERPDNVCPLLNDTDLKIEYVPETHSLEENVYDTLHVKNVVKIYQNQLKTKMVNYQPKHGICFVLEKDKPTLSEDKTMLKNGFHLHFINAYIRKCDLSTVILKGVKKEIDEIDLFSDIGISDSGNCIDEIASKYWLLYGSTKKGSKKFYEISRIYDENLKEITLEEALKDYELYNTEGELIELNKENIQYHLPRIMSLSCENKQTLRLKQQYEECGKKDLQTINTIQKSIDNVPIQERLKRAGQMLELLSKERADNYNEWIEIGWILHNVSEGTYEGFVLWNDFSKLTSKKDNYSESYCLYQWKNMKDVNCGKTIASLYHYAKLDNPEEYKKIQTRKNQNLIQNAFVNKGQQSLAMWLYEHYKDQFVCASIEKDIWYEYKEHRWHLTSKGIELRKKISVHLREEMIQQRKKVCTEMVESSSENNYYEEEYDDRKNNKKTRNPDKELNDELKSINQLIGKLEDNSFKTGIMKECQELFYQSDFFSKLDQDPYYLHFTNGVLDMKEMIFRKGKQTDYISLTTGYDFKENFNVTDMEILEATDHLEKTFPDRDLREYFIEYCASLLKGGNFNKTFVVMTGAGDNGKSVNIDIIYNILGDYAKPLPTSLIFGKRTQSSSATPELASVIGIRFAALQESSEKDTINNGILKELTGNDKLSARALFKEQITFRPQLKLCLICNKLPKITADDPATWARLRVLPYLSSFPKDASKVPIDLKEQRDKKIFPRDPNMDEKVKELKQAFMWIFWNRYKYIQKHGKMDDPKRVSEATIIYRMRNDHFGSFVNERIVFLTEEQRTKNFINFNTIYTAFGEWYMETYPNSVVPSKIDSFDELKIKLKLEKDITMARAKWYSCRLKTIAEINGEEESPIKFSSTIIENIDEIEKINSDNIDIEDDIESEYI